MTELTSQQIDENADALIAARPTGELLDALPHPPESAADGYAIQDATIERMTAPVVGWKVGATAQFAMELFGVDEPFAGPVFDGDLFDSSDGPIDVSRYPAPSVEGEFAFVLAADLPARSEEYGREEVVAAIGEVHGAIELVQPRMAGFPLALPNMLADCSGNGGLALGAPSGDWTAVDLLAAPASMTIAGEVTGSGVGADAYGDPVESLRWLANHLSGRGLGLVAGMAITTGSCTGIAPLPEGGSATADFGPLGSVTVRR